MSDKPKAVRPEVLAAGLMEGVERLLVDLRAQLENRISDTEKERSRDTKDLLTQISVAQERAAILSDEISRVRTDQFTHKENLDKRVESIEKQTEEVRESIIGDAEYFRNLTTEQVGKFAASLQEFDASIEGLEARNNQLESLIGDKNDQVLDLVIEQVRDIQGQMERAWRKDVDEIDAKLRQFLTDPEIGGLIDACTETLYERLSNVEALTKELDACIEASVANLIGPQLQELIAQVAGVTEQVSKAELNDSGRLEKLLEIQKKNDEEFEKSRRELEAFAQQISEETEFASQRTAELSTRVDGAYSAASDLTETMKQVTSNVAEIRNWRETLEDQFKERLEERDKQSSARIENLEEGFEERIEQTVGVAHRQVLNVIQRNFGDVRPWTPDGASFQIGSYARHRGGLWQARVRTITEPGESQDWQLILTGIWKHKHVPRVDRSGMDTYILDSAGSTLTILGTKYPFEFRGTWDPQKEYGLGDVVVRDGCTWALVVVSSSEDPKSSKDWKLLAMRGSRGKKGEKGDPPARAEIEAIVRDVLDEGEGVPLARFRGIWKYQSAYRRGDVCLHQNMLLSCVENNDGAMPPGIGPDGMPNKHWAIMYNVSIPAPAKN